MLNRDTVAQQLVGFAGVGATSGLTLKEGTLVEDNTKRADLRIAATALLHGPLCAQNGHT